MRKTIWSLIRKWLTHQLTMRPEPNSRQAKDERKEQLSSKLSDNYAILEETFRDCSDIVLHRFAAGAGIPERLVLFAQGMVDEGLLGEVGLLPLISGTAGASPMQVPIPEADKTDSVTGILDAVVSGNAVLLEDGSAHATILSVAGAKRRGVQEPTTEAVIRGPKEGFTEQITVNTALIRNKIKSPKLKYKSFIVGKHTRTKVVLAYMEGLAPPDIIEEVSKRLGRIQLDGVLESGYIEEMIEDDSASPFPQLQYSERPDTIAGQLLEGKFAILTDGTPFVLTGPATAFQFLQASEDYFEQFHISTMLRWLRYSFLFVGLFLPALYIAVTTFHQDMLPTSLIISIASSRENIPFPALVEALIMEIAFEVLREAGIRLPKSIGQTVSILGALVIGQSAVQAGIVSAPVVIVVSMTGIASFAIPKYNFAIAIRMLRFPLMILAGVFGLFGIIIGTLWIAAHLCKLTSFGVPYLEGLAPMKPKELKDILARAPWWLMKSRPTEGANDRPRVQTDRQFVKSEE